MTDRIDIVGIAAQCGLGASVKDAIDAMRRDAPGMRPAAALEQRPCREPLVGEVRGRRMARSGRFRAEHMLRSTLLQLLASVPAETLPANNHRIGIVIGTTVGGMRHCGKALRLLAAGERTRALDVLGAVPAGRVLHRAIRDLPIRGPAVTISCACASALSAVAHGVALLRARVADAVVVGGYDPVSEFVYGGFTALQLVAPGLLRPFAESRDGMKLGEGCALLMLQRARDIALHGTRSFGSVAGIGESCDAYHLTNPHSEGRGAVDALRQAIEGEGLPDLLLAHATGTPANDAAEYEAYRRGFGPSLAQVPVAALKSRFGHPLGAAGAMELVLALAAAERELRVAGSGPEPDPKAFPDLQLARGPANPANPRRLMGLAAGFGGVNVAIMVDRKPEAGLPKSSSASRQVRVTGWGAITPGGRGMDGLHRLMADSGGRVPDEVLDELVSRARTRRMAALPRLVMAAIEDLRLQGALASEELRETPVLCATWHGAADFTERYYRDLVESGIDLANPLLFAESVPNIGSAHASIGFGIRAACVSVIGCRGAALQSLALARARIVSGHWSRALVVAAEESHWMIDSTLSRFHGSPVASSAGAVAVLLRGLACDQSGVGDPAPCATSRMTSASPLDQALLNGEEAVGVRGIPEMGSVTPLAVAMMEMESRPDRVTEVMSAEPGGGSNSAQFGVGGRVLS